MLQAPDFIARRAAGLVDGRAPSWMLRHSRAVRDIYVSAVFYLAAAVVTALIGQAVDASVIVGVVLINALSSAARRVDSSLPEPRAR